MEPQAKRVIRAELYRAMDPDPLNQHLKANGFKATWCHYNYRTGKNQPPEMRFALKVSHPTAFDRSALLEKLEAAMTEENAVRAGGKVYRLKNISNSVTARNLIRRPPKGNEILLNVAHQ